MDLEKLNIDVGFMIEALKEAEAAKEADEVPIGCVIVAPQGGGKRNGVLHNGGKRNRGRIIARAHNLVQTLNDPTAHAEMQAITSATAFLGGKYLTDCTIYVTVEPCPMCAAALNWAQIGRVVYGCTDPKRGAGLYSPNLYHPKTELSAGVLEAECAQLVKDFFKKKR